MGEYRKKPVVIEAVRYIGNGNMEDGEVPEWLWKALEDGTARSTNGMDPFVIHTPEGDHTCSPGDWIIRGVAGELYPCKPDIFAATYEPAGASAGTTEGPTDEMIRQAIGVLNTNGYVVAAQILASAVRAAGTTEPEGETEELRRELAEFEASFDLYDRCMRRAKDLFYEQHPDFPRDVWPDGAKSIVALFEELARLEREP